MSQTVENKGASAPLPEGRKALIVGGAIVVLALVGAAVIGGFAGVVYSALALGLAAGGFAAVTWVKGQAAKAGWPTWALALALAGVGVVLLAVVAALWWLLLPLVGLGAAASKAVR